MQFSARVAVKDQLFGRARLEHRVIVNLERYLGCHLQNIRTSNQSAYIVRCHTKGVEAKLKLNSIGVRSIQLLQRGLTHRRCVRFLRPSA